MSNRTSAALALFLGVGLLTGSFFFARSTRRLLATAEHTSGTVVGFERRTSKRGRSEYPIIEFAAGGETHRFTTTGAGSYARGEKVDVLYDAGDPANARVNAFFELWLGALALGGFGVLCLGAGIATVVLEGRSKAKASSAVPSL